MTNKELAKIVKLVKQDKEANFQLLFDEICKVIYYITLKTLADPSEAEDAVQEILIRIYNHIDDLKADEGFNEWMNTIIFRVCHTQMKKDSRKKKEQSWEEYKENEAIEANLIPEKIVLTNEQRKDLMALIDQLPLKQKEVIWMYYYEQLSGPEISRILGCSLATVQNRLYKAKKAIARKMNIHTGEKREKLYSLPIFTLLTGLFKSDAGRIFTDDIRNRLKDNFYRQLENNGANHRQTGRRGALSHFPLGGIVVCAVFFIGLTGWAAARLYFLESVKNEIEVTAADESEAAYSPLWQERESILATDNFIESTPAVANERGGDVNEQSSGFDGQTENPVQWITVTGAGTTVFENEAKVIDEDLQDLEYEGKADGKSGHVYGAEEYSSSSEVVYHEASPVILKVNKNASGQDKVNPGDNICYQIIVKNTGAEEARNIIIKDKIPEKTEYIKASASTDTIRIEEEDSFILWTIPRLAPAAETVLYLEVKVSKNISAGEIIANVAGIRINDSGFTMTNRVELAATGAESARTSDDRNDSGLIRVVLLAGFVILIISVKKRFEMRDTNEN